MHCIKCGAKNQDDANFCYKCGSRIARTTMTGADVPGHTRLITLVILVVLAILTCGAITIVGLMYATGTLPG